MTTREEITTFFVLILLLLNLFDNKSTIEINP
jgi:hypothetical protein